MHCGSKMNMFNAHNYLAGNSAMHLVARQLFPMLLQQLPESSSHHRLLDIGCGTGDVLTQILLPQIKEFESVLGVDVANNMVEYCQKTYASKRVRFKVADMGSLSVATEIGGTFHRIFSSLCLHWIADHKQALKNIHDLLTPDGYAVLIFIISDSNFSMLEQMSKKPEWKGLVKDLSPIFAPYLTSSDPAKMFTEAAVEQKLHVQYLSEHTFYFRHPSVADFTTLLKSINPFIHTVPENQKSHFMQQCTEEGLALKNVKLHEDGTVTVRFQTVNAVLNRANCSNT